MRQFVLHAFQVTSITIVVFHHADQTSSSAKVNALTALVLAQTVQDLQELNAHHAMMVISLQTPLVHQDAQQVTS